MSVTVYGKRSCPDTMATLEYLQQRGGFYEFVDIADDAVGREVVKSHNQGREVTPTIKVEDVYLCNPSRDELEQALKERDGSHRPHNVQEPNNPPLQP